MSYMEHIIEHSLVQLDKAVKNHDETFDLRECLKESIELNGLPTGLVLDELVDICNYVYFTWSRHIREEIIETYEKGE